MRSKEVEEAIEQLKEDANIIIYGNQIFEDRTTCEKDDLKTVLAYIEELEEKWERDCHKIHEIIRQEKELDKKYIDKQVIRDKIKELENKIKIEHNEKVIVWLHKQKIILKSLLGE